MITFINVTIGLHHKIIFARFLENTARVPIANKSADKRLKLANKESSYIMANPFFEDLRHEMAIINRRDSELNKFKRAF